MRRSVIIVLVLSLFLLILLPGCTEDETPLIMSQLANKADKSLVDGKADKSMVDEVSKRANDAKSRADEAYNKANEALTKAQEALNKANEAYTKATTVPVPTTPAPGTPAPAIPASNLVSMTVWKEPASMIYDPGTFTWWLEITNGFAEYKKVFVNVDAVYVDNVKGDLLDTTKFFCPDLQSSGNPDGNFSMSFVPSISGGVSTDCTKIHGSSQGAVVIKGLNKVVIPVSMVLNYNNSDRTRWTVQFSTTAYNYP